MNCTIKQVTVKRYYYDSQRELGTRLRHVIDASHYDFRLKTLKGLTPFDYIYKI